MLICVKPIDVERVLREVAGLIGPHKASHRSPPACRPSRWSRSSTRTCRSSASCRTSASRSAPARSASRPAASRTPRPRQRVLDWLRLLGYGRARRGAAVRRRHRALRLGPGVHRPRGRGLRGRRDRLGPDARKARELILTTMTGTAALLDETDLACSDPAADGHVAGRHVGGGPRADGAARAFAARSSTACWRPCGAPASSDRRRPLSRSDLASFVQALSLVYIDHDLRVHRARAPAHPVQLAHRPGPRVPRPDGVSRS